MFGVYQEIRKTEHFEGCEFLEISWISFVYLLAALQTHMYIFIDFQRIMK